MVPSGFFAERGRIGGVVILAPRLGLAGVPAAGTLDLDDLGGLQGSAHGPSVRWMTHFASATKQTNVGPSAILIPRNGHPCPAREDTMTDQDKAPGQSDDTDTGGHIYRRSADAESAERDDTEGHMPFSRGADADSAEGDTDTEGHINFRRPERDYDTEGHMPYSRGAEAESAEGDDDVTGHVYIENRDDLNQQRLR
jgi:hypothetical protein